MNGGATVRRRTRATADSGSDWGGILSILGSESEYTDRIDAALAYAGTAAGAPDAYLYLIDAGARRFHLERARARAAADPARARSPAPATTEGGAEWSAPTPPLEVLHTSDDDRDRTVTTPIGRLWSVRLPAADGSLLGLLQVGPVPGGDADVPEAITALRVPLAFVIERARREEDLRQRLATTAAQLEAGQRLASSALDLDRFVQLLLGMALKSTRSDAGFVAVVDPGSGFLRVRAEHGMAPGFRDEVDLSPEHGLFDWSPAAEGGALMLRDLDAATRLGIRSLLAVPLVEDGEPLGVVALVSYGQGPTFDEQGLELLETFADQIRLMLHNQRLYDAFSERYLETVKGLARSLDARRPHTRGHHEAIARAGGAIALDIGLAVEEVDAIRTAGLIHDVGLAASAGIEGGFEADVEHPTVGASLIEHIPLHPFVASGVAMHHEWYDGWGFPQGLKGDEISLSGRILAAAEFLVEMSAGEPVRASWSAERLAVEVQRRSGSQFDPRVADAAVRLLEQDGLGLRPGEHDGMHDSPEDKESDR